MTTSSSSYRHDLDLAERADGYANEPTDADELDELRAQLRAVTAERDDAVAELALVRRMWSSLSTQWSGLAKNYDAGADVWARGWWEGCARVALDVAEHLTRWFEEHNRPALSRITDV